MKPEEDYKNHLPRDLTFSDDLQKDIPRLAKSARAMRKIEAILPQLPTQHRIFQADARKISFLEKESVHLVITSPPYWTLKKYNDNVNQLGDIRDYNVFLKELDKVWRHCFRVLVPGGRLVCVVGDVCLSRRKNAGRHRVIPLHASIQEHCIRIGFDNLTPIMWHKIANATYEAQGNGGGFLGKPYEPNGIVKNDIEYILMERKPGGYRSPPLAQRLLSIISETDHKHWFQSIWTGLTGASTKQHPAPFPEELATRLIRMFSFVGDTVLDPFLGSGTTSVAAENCGRNSIGVELDPEYFAFAESRLHGKTDSLLSNATVAATVKTA